jgi:hypothetical protein
MYCRHCGSVVSEQQKFCKQCGRQQQPENQDQIESMIISSAGVFVWVCFIILFIMSMKLIEADNYLGVIASLLGGGAVIAAFYQWQKRRQKQETTTSTQPAFERKEVSYLPPPNEIVSVIAYELSIRSLAPVSPRLRRIVSRVVSLDVALSRKNTNRR